MFSVFRGGIKQTVMGNHFTSVHSPFMTLTIVCVRQNKSSEVVKEKCKVENDSVMSCPTPQLDEGFAQCNDGSDVIKRRLDRDDVVQFHAGLVFAGVLKYRNLTESFGN